MFRHRGLPLLAVLLLAALLAGAASPNRLDHAWRQYKNPQRHYCVSYPSHWAKADAYEGAGLVVETGAKKFAKPSGEIDVAALSPQPFSNAPSASLTLVDDLKLHLDGLAKFERAERLEVLEQRPLTLGGKPALFTKNRYYDPLERASWVEELVFAHDGDLLYRLELQCRADQVERFEPVFTHLVSTFDFDCPNAH